MLKIFKVRVKINVEHDSDEEILGTIGEHVKVNHVPRHNMPFMNENLTKIVPPIDSKFNEFNVGLVSMVYEHEEKEEEKSLYSSAMINPSHIGMKLKAQSKPNSARVEISPRMAPKLDTVSVVNNITSVQKMSNSPESNQFQFFKKNPLLPPSPSSRDPNFVLKGKIRDLIQHTEQLYQKMVMEKNKIDKK